MTVTVTAKIQLRKGTAAQWTSANPVLLAGEEGYETDTGRKKIGDGTTAWTLLAYYHDPDLSGVYAPLVKGVTNGDSHDHSGGDGAQIAYSTLSGLPTLGTAAATDSTDYATDTQGATADSAMQPGDDAAYLGSGAATDGYVLTADGAGGAAWEAATGGSSHDPVTVSDSASIDLTLTGQQISAAAKFGTTSGTVCQGNDSRVTGALPASGGTRTNYRETRYTVTTSGNITLDLANGNVQRLILDANRQITLPGDPGDVGQSFVLILECATFTPTWNSSPAIKWLTSDGTAPTLVTTANLVNVLSFVWDDTDSRWLGFLAGKETA